MQFVIPLWQIDLEQVSVALGIYHSAGADPALINVAVPNSQIHMTSSYAERSRRMRVSPDGRYTKTEVADVKVSYFYICPVPSPIDL